MASESFDIALSLPDDMKAFVESQAAAEGHESASDYVRALIRAAQREKGLQALESELQAGLASPLSEMTAADWSDIKAEARRR